MTACRRVTGAVLLALLLAGAAGAQGLGPPPIPAKPNPRLALTAALINLVYIPPRIALTALTGVVGGLTGFLTFGDEAATRSIFGLTSGPQVITPQMLEGTERWHLGDYD